MSPYAPLTPEIRTWPPRLPPVLTGNNCAPNSVRVGRSSSSGPRTCGMRRMNFRNWTVLSRISCGDRATGRRNWCFPAPAPFATNPQPGSGARHYSVWSFGLRGKDSNGRPREQRQGIGDLTQARVPSAGTWGPCWTIQEHRLTLTGWSRFTLIITRQLLWTPPS